MYQSPELNNSLFSFQLCSVTVHFATLGCNFAQIELYFHCASEGTKLDLIRKDNRATFEMDCNHNFILYEERMSCTMGYESVIGHGTIEFIDDEHKFEALKILMNQYHAEDFKFNTAMMKVTTVFKLVVSDMTGKRRNNIH